MCSKTVSGCLSDLQENTGGKTCKEMAGEWVFNWHQNPLRMCSSRALSFNCIFSWRWHWGFFLCLHVFFHAMAVASLSSVALSWDRSWGILKVGWLVGWLTTLRCRDSEAGTFGLLVLQTRPHCMHLGRANYIIITLLTIHSPTVDLHILEAKGYGVSSTAIVARALTTQIQNCSTYPFLLLWMLLGFIRGCAKRAIPIHAEKGCHRRPQLCADPGSVASVSSFISPYLHVSSLPASCSPLSQLPNIFNIQSFFLSSLLCFPFLLLRLLLSLLLLLRLLPLSPASLAS